MLSTLDTLIARIATMEDDEAGFWRQVFKGHKVTAQDFFNYVPNKLSLLDYNPRDAAMGENLIRSLPEHRHAALNQQLALLDRELEQLYAFPEDLALARIADAQGLGGASGTRA